MSIKNVKMDIGRVNMQHKNYIEPFLDNLKYTIVDTYNLRTNGHPEITDAEREKMAVITKAAGELEASKNLAEAAEKLSSAPGALHLRTLSTINDISSDQSNTIVFAIPLEILRAFEGTKVTDVVKALKDKN